MKAKYLDVEIEIKAYRATGASGWKENAYPIIIWKEVIKKKAKNLEIGSWKEGALI